MDSVIVAVYFVNVDIGEIYAFFGVACGGFFGDMVAVVVFDCCFVLSELGSSAVSDIECRGIF